MSIKARNGRFSSGHELLAETDQHVRVGSFGDGHRTMDARSEDLRIGRFSSGHEMLAETDQHVRVGSFGDHEEARSTLTLHRSAEPLEEMEAERA